MRSPAEMQIILIDITNACTERCSNCMRFCGNHKAPFFMDYSLFCRAVDAMEGFGGLVALIGGEPTLHPESADEIDDVSPTLYEKLEKVGSPRLKAGKTHLVRIEDGRISAGSKAAGKRFFATQKYVEHYEDRFSAAGSLLFADHYETCFVPDGKEFGHGFNKMLGKAEEWILFTEREDAAAEADGLLKCVLNPGTMHLGDGFAFFSKNALSLKAFGFDRIAHTASFQEILSMWQPDKVVHLEDTERVMEWKRASIQPGKRYAIWGMGVSGSFLADAVKSSGGILSLAADKDKAKQGTDFYGARVCAPEELAKCPEEYDFLLVGHYSRFQEIAEEAHSLGIPKEKIMMPYEV